MPNEQTSIPAITDKRLVPPGILPRNIHHALLGGVAIVMVIVIFFSGRSTPKSRTPAAPGPEATAVPSNEDRLKEYKQRIEAESRKLAAEQAQLSQAKKAWSGSGYQYISPGSEGPGGNFYASPMGSSQSEPTQKSWIQQEREKRDYESRFASNLALTYRPDTKPTKSDVPAEPSGGLPAIDPRLYPWPLVLPQTNQVPELPGEVFKPARGFNGSATSDRAEHGSKTSPADLSHAHGKNYRLFEGTIIETVLTNRLDGTFSGPVNCMVSADVYSHDHGHILIPAGSRVLGNVHSVEGSGQQRLAVTFDRLIMPDGYSVNLDQFHGLDQIGETGLRDQVNHHYAQIFGASIAIGMIAGLAQSNTQYGTSTSATDAYRQGVSNSLAQSSIHILDRFLNVLPTFTVREGQRIKIYLAEDLILPAYENHEMPDDI
jgi:type IV secretion system protein TrbI